MLQLKPAAWPKDIPALNVMGVCWGHASERDHDRPEQDDHTTGYLTPPFDCAGMLRQHLSLVYQHLDAFLQAISVIHGLVLRWLR